MKLRERYKRLSFWTKLAVWLGVLGTLASFAGILLAILFHVFQASPPVPIEHYGFLYPANDPTPPNPCGSVSDSESFLVLIGGNAFRLTGKQRYFTPISARGKPLVRIERSTLGIQVYAEVIREDGRLAVTISENKFIINPNNYFTVRRPDRHEFSVRDKEGQLVIKARFLNERTFRIEGRFFAPGYGSVIVDEDGITAESQGAYTKLSGSCISDVVAGLVIVPYGIILGANDNDFKGGI